MISEARARIAVALLLALPTGAWAQPAISGQQVDPMPKWVAAQIDDPADPRVQEYARRQKHRVELEKELYKLRAEYFGGMRNTEIRQIGISKLRKYTDPVLYPSLLKIFAREKMDVRGAVLDILADQKDDEADTTLAWGAIFDKDKEFRDAAAVRLHRRITENGGVATDRMKTVIAQGLNSDQDDELAVAAGLCQTLKLFEAIPLLISKQLGGGGAAVGGGGGGQGADTSLAWILVGTQTAYVSDLQPVVGDNAVGFDPELSVITEGTYLRVIDAVVVTYRTEVHNALVGLSSEAWDRPTGYLGWDNPAWRKWYTDEFKPYLAQKQAEAAQKAKEAATPAAAPPQQATPRTTPHGG